MAGRDVFVALATGSRAVTRLAVAAVFALELVHVGVSHQLTEAVDRARWDAIEPIIGLVPVLGLALLAGLFATHAWRSGAPLAAAAPSMGPYREPALADERGVDEADARALLFCGAAWLGGQLVIVVLGWLRWLSYSSAGDLVLLADLALAGIVALAWARTPSPAPRRSLRAGSLALFGLACTTFVERVLDSLERVEVEPGSSTAALAVQVAAAALAALAVGALARALDRRDLVTPRAVYAAVLIGSGAGALRALLGSLVLAPSLQIGLCLGAAALGAAGLLLRRLRAEPTRAEPSPRRRPARRASEEEE
ncbi:MAG: hypothetical protein KF729_31565 [Sandaracinaceae bacterium]|nr:hypothetical protein [Sandaracinaceae bacterium]